jgi:putative transposase
MAIRVDRKLNSTDVLDALTDLFILRGVPESSVPIMGRSSSPRRCGTGSTPSAPRRPTSNQAHPWENGYCESFNARFRDELLNGESSTA